MGISCLQVYVTVFADGPTRVLRFSDEPSTVNLEAEQSILDLAARLKQVLAHPPPLTPTPPWLECPHKEMWIL